MISCQSKRFLWVWYTVKRMKINFWKGFKNWIESRKITKKNHGSNIYWCSLKLVCLLPSETHPELKMIDDGSDKNETIAKQFPLCKYLSVSFSAQYKAITKCRYLVYQGSSYFLNRFEILNLFYETLSVLQTSTSLSKFEKNLDFQALSWQCKILTEVKVALKNLEDSDLALVLTFLLQGAL